MLVPVAWFWIERTRPGLHLRAVGEHRRRPTRRASTCTGRATPTCSSAACWPASPGATITLAISPGWFGDQTVNGRGWIAVGLVIFAQWSPVRAAVGAYLFGAIFRFILDIQGVPHDPRRREPFQAGRSATFFLEMLPYLMVILVVARVARGATASGSARRPRSGLPYVRGERGRLVVVGADVRPCSSIWTNSLGSKASWRAIR